METRKNKPRAFLSHSKTDIDFIRRIRDDLRKCQIEPWIDEDDIRHGKPWLDSIFEDGIPTCDSVIVYFSFDALQSRMVKKEIDASILSQLADKRIAFLPYVSNASIRKDLRPDIQSLQVQEWNSNNYFEILPRVVAEIWRSFMERSVHAATQEEENRRLRLELELQKAKHEGAKGVFSAAEEADFTYLWNSLDRTNELIVEEKESVGTQDGSRMLITVAKHKFSLHLGSLVGQLITLDRTQYPFRLEYILGEKCEIILPAKQESVIKNVFNVTKFEDPRDELLTYGLIQGFHEPAPQRSEVRVSYFSPVREKYPFTEKMYRFRYWLAFTKKLPEAICIKLLGK